MTLCTLFASSPSRYESTEKDPRTGEHTGSLEAGGNYSAEAERWAESASEKLTSNSVFEHRFTANRRRSVLIVSYEANGNSSSYPRTRLS